MKALILAGGRGSRLNEFTRDTNKSMIRLFEKPLIAYNLEHASKAKVREIIIVVGYRKEGIITYVGKEFRGIPVRYVEQKEQRGIVHAIECAREVIGESDFFLMLGDEILIDPHIKEMLRRFRKKDLYVLCGVAQEREKASISKTYSVMGDENGRIFRLIEKPRFPINMIKGTGHCIMKNDILSYISKTPINMNRGERELVDMIQLAIDEGKKVEIMNLTKGYVNVNTEEDFRLAQELIKKNNPRVLIVHTQMKFLGGAELLIVELANWLTKRGIKNDILALSTSKEVEEKLINSEVIIPRHTIDLQPPGFKNMKDILQFVRIYRKTLRKIIDQYDVINFHNFPVTWTLFPRRKPCVWMLNEPPNLWSRPDAGIFLKTMNRLRSYLDREIVRNSIDRICVADDFNYVRALTRYKKKARVVYYGVNYNFFSGGNEKKAIEKWGLKNKFVVVQSGMMTRTKNQLESVKAIETIKDTIPHVLLVLAGKAADEDYEKELKTYIKEHMLGNDVLLTGNLSRDDIRDLYAASNVGLYPVGQQGGWLAPFEHLCSAKPVIVSESLGAASLFRTFHLGIITRDYPAGILDCYHNKETYTQQGIEARDFVKKNLGWDVFADAMIEEFKRAWRKY